MSSNPAEPEKYTLDDMMDRLQSKPDASPEEAGELVTRADGSQAIKVRKRKRRSTQPHKEAAKRAVRMRAIQISSAVILLILLALTFGGLIIYANSSPFRQGVIDKVSGITGAKTKFHLFRVNPTASNITLADFQWPSGNVLKSLSLTDVQTKALLAGAVSKNLGFDEISAGSGKLLLGAVKEGEPAVFSRREGPSGISFDRLGVAKLDTVIGDPAQPALQLLNAEASLYPENINGHPTVRLFKGDVKIPDWPAFRLDRSLLEFNGTDVQIVSLRLLHELDPQGTIEISGSIRPYEFQKEQFLAVKVDTFNLNGIAGPVLGNLIAGRIDTREAEGSNRIRFSTGSTPASSLDLAFSASVNSPTRLNGFPFQAVLSQLFENRWLAEPMFEDESTGNLHRENGIVRLSNLSFATKTQMRLTGNLTLTPTDSLDGELQIGVPEAAVIASNNPRLRELFKDGREGYRWVNLKISGTGSRPVDNLAQLYESLGNAPASSGPANSFENLTAPK